MKLSFSLPSSKSSKSNSVKPPTNFDDSSTDLTTTTSKHLITQFDPSKHPTLTQPKTLIPPIQNQWRASTKPKSLYLPTTNDSTASHSPAFESDTSSAADRPVSDMSYGLNVRRSTNDDNNRRQQTYETSGDVLLQRRSGSDMSYGLNVRSSTNDDNNRRQQTEETNGDVLLQGRTALEVTMLQKLREDLRNLPDDQGFDEFKDVPVEGFGAALLAGYGWSEGMGIGKNEKEDVKVVEVKKRTGREGLGFVGDAPSSKKEETESNKNMEEEEEEEGEIVRIVWGRDAGLKGSVVSRIGNDYLVLKLLGSREQVKVKVDDVAELGSKEEERCLGKLKDLKIRQRDRDEVDVKMVNDSDRGSREEHGKKQVSWLTSHIRVRVISRDFKGGRLYKEKGEVLDVVDPTTCDISMDESREIIQGVSQEYLETVLPRLGGPVLVLYGKHNGAFGSLVEKDLDSEIGIVRDADTHELLNVKLEQIAEYIGDPSLLGH